MAVSQLIEMTSRGKASLNRVSELLDAKQDVVDKPDVEDVKDIEGRIEFRHPHLPLPRTASSTF